MEETAKSVVKGIVKGAVSLVPVAGPIMTAIYDEVVSGALKKRRDEWERIIEKRLEALEDAELVDKLIGNESFVTCLVEATQQALLTHQQSKIDMLANAVVNSIKDDISEDKKQIFIRLIQRYSELHIVILTALDEPILTLVEKGVNVKQLNQKFSITDFFNALYPDKQFDEDLISIVIRDLHADGLLTTNKDPNQNLQIIGFEGFTTQIGKEFLKYVTKKDE